MIGERKISNQSTTGPTASTAGPCPTIIQISQIPRSPFSTIGQISRLSMNLMGTPTNMYNIRTVVQQGLLSALLIWITIGQCPSVHFPSVLAAGAGGRLWIFY